MRRRTTAAALAVLLLTACSANSSGTSQAPAVTPTPITSTSSHAPPRPPRACGARATAFWLPGPDNTKLEANAFGRGRTAAVFLHEAGSLADMCGFWQYARWLARRDHVLVVLFNRCTYGRSTCDVFQTGDEGIVEQVQPAVDWARRHGARRVTLVGASTGASDALQAAGVVRHVDAVVALSNDITDTGAEDLPDARRLRVPALFAVAPDDRYSDLGKVRAAYRAAASGTKRLVIVRNDPGTHGWDLLYHYGSGFTPLAGIVAEWVTGHGD